MGKHAERAELRRRLRAAESGLALLASKWPEEHPPRMRAATRCGELRQQIEKLTEQIAAETPQPQRRRKHV